MREKQDNPKYSVITPMYNSFLLMDSYFSSFLNQDYKNFELIIVDDCSSDGSYEKLREYVEQSPLNICVCRSEKNGGPGNARNIGIKTARGEWILFVDSDDYVESDFFSALEASRIEEIDIVLFDYYRVKGSHKESIKSVRTVKKEDISKEEALLWKGTSVWGGVYRSSIIKDNSIVFPPLYRFEDWVFFVKLLSFSFRVKYLHRPLYNYVYNENSLVHVKSENVYKYSIDAIKHLKYDFDGYPERIVEALFIREVLYVAGREQLSRYNPDELKKALVFVQGYFPSWKKNPYIRKFSTIQKVIIRIIQSRQFFLFKIAGLFLIVASRRKSKN